MVRLCGASLGLFAFAIAIVQGLLAGNSTSVILSRALWALFAFCMIGLLVGWVSFRVLDEHASKMNREMFPEVEEEEAESGATDQARMESGGS